MPAKRNPSGPQYDFGALQQALDRGRAGSDPDIIKAWDDVLGTVLTLTMDLPVPPNLLPGTAPRALNSMSFRVFVFSLGMLASHVYPVVWRDSLTPQAAPQDMDDISRASGAWKPASRL